METPEKLSPIAKSLEEDLIFLRRVKERLIVARKDISDMGEALPVLEEHLRFKCGVVRMSQASLEALKTFHTFLATKSDQDLRLQRDNPYLDVLSRHPSVLPKAIADQVTNLQETIRDCTSECTIIGDSIMSIKTLMPVASESLESLDQARKSIQKEINTKSSLGSPIHRLPDEVLILILRDVLAVEREDLERNLASKWDNHPPEPKGIANLMRVCSTWMTLLTKTRFADCSLMVRTETNIFPQLPSGCGYGFLFMMQTAENALRWKEFVDNIHSTEWPVQATHVRFETQVLAQTQTTYIGTELYLYCRRNYATFELPVVPGHATLRKLFCRDLIPTFTHKHPMLRSLTITSGSNISWDSIATAFDHMPDLTELTLDCCIPASLPSPVIASSLRSLNLSRNMNPVLVSLLMNGLSFPNLRSLSIIWMDNQHVHLSALLGAGRFSDILLSLILSGMKPFSPMSWSSFPVLTSLTTLSLGGACSQIYAQGLLEIQQDRACPALCPSLSHIVIRNSSIAGDTLNSLAKIYAAHRTQNGSGEQFKFIVEVHDCPNISVEQLRELRLLRE